jgi:AcrR family transcriptional regulator
MDESADNQPLITELEVPSPRKHQILEAAAQVFREKGFHAATMEDIGDLVGMNKATLYYWVASKEAVFFELLQTGMIETLASIAEAIHPGMSAIEKLRTLIHVHIRDSALRANTTVLVLREQHVLQGAQAESHRRFRRQYEKVWYDAFEQGVAEGVIRDSPAHMGEFFLFGALNWFSHWYHPDGRMTPQQIADSFCDFFFRGFLTEEGAMELKASGGHSR